MPIETASQAAVAFLRREAAHMQTDNNPVMQAAGNYLEATAHTIEGASPSTFFDYERTLNAAINFATTYHTDVCRGRDHA
jgi:hypothetical protein